VSRRKKICQREKSFKEDTGRIGENRKKPTESTNSQGKDRGGFTKRGATGKFLSLQVEEKKDFSEGKTGAGVKAFWKRERGFGQGIWRMVFSKKRSKLGGKSHSDLTQNDPK